jgi:hypothetical protein
MKTGIKVLALLFLISLFGSGCATVGRLNAEYEEETVRIEQMSAEEKAAFEEDKLLEEKIELQNWID